jgi:hypothetical protein
LILRNDLRFSLNADTYRCFLLLGIREITLCQN